MTELQTLFAQVLVPVPVPKTYTYRIPYDWNDWVHEGLRVAVQFGPKKIYAGIVIDIVDQAPLAYQASYILDILDESPIVGFKQLQFWRWVAKYYMCYLGEVMATALPAGYRLQSETRIALHPDADLSVVLPEELDDLQWHILKLLGKKDSLSLDEIHQKLAVKNVLKLIKLLYLRGLIVMEEELKDSYRPKFEEVIALTSFWEDSSVLNETLNGLEKRAPKQYEAMMVLLGLGKKEVPIEMLTKQNLILRETIKQLAKKGFLSLHKLRRNHLQVTLGVSNEYGLNEEQSQALDTIQEAFDNGKPALLFGVTGSGKTHVYMELVKQSISQGKQVLYLLPEVALTEHMVTRMAAYLPIEIGVWHHYYSSHERTELYDRILKNQIQFVVGTKGAVFAPFHNLGLIVIDEEHESSYKQFEKKPYFNGRDASFQLANIHGANILLGSATPSYEMQFAVSHQKIVLARLHKKYDGGATPSLIYLNIADLKRAGKMTALFSDPAKMAIDKALENRQRVVVYHNRKGYVPYIECEQCGLATQCKNCDIALTYYKSSDNQRCSYCNYQQQVPSRCAACGSHEFKLKGTGTEKLAEELGQLYPKARVARFDQQSMLKRDDFQKTLTAFQRGDIDILVGTQLLSKGIDIENIGLVVVADADMILHIPDFKSHERAFQQFQQLAGRIGRRAEKGVMILQTYQPNHPVLQALKNDNYNSLMCEEMIQREAFGYPPYTKLLKIDVKHLEIQVASDASRWFAEQLKKKLGNQVLGPIVPSVARIKNRFVQQIMVKIPRDSTALVATKNFVQTIREQALLQNVWRSVRIDIVVDPS
ncbi:MAG: primosomal protein N' [Flavobacteriaceae bacterium]|nr:primosomal protein N' [Flavobacteriaceae bacterium]